jgi:hypothetical protein
MGAAFGAALAIALGVLAVYGTGEKAVRTALDITARWSFILFWLAYVAGPLGVVFRPAFAGLARRGRDLGLAFAAAHLVHVGLVVWLGLILNRVPLQGWLLWFFLAGLFFTYLLAMLSFGAAELLGAGLWRGIMFVAMNYILIAFARDFFVGALRAQELHREGWRIADYSILALLCIVAPLLRVAAAARRRADMRPSPA